jgi:hypothetical protein
MTESDYRYVATGKKLTPEIADELFIVVQNTLKQLEGEQMTTETQVQVRVPVYIENLGKRFDKMDRGDGNDRNCLNCLNCKVLPAAQRDKFGIEMTACAAGLWRGEHGELITMPITRHENGSAVPLRKRQDCPSFEASL